ncbi:hypothetical protein ACIQ8D_31255 [Streptomyces sp. NPDC096094]|uniref:hypothetical protein n=1 Tax=Streptomyces sp. NPDC096094 TaxID=3366073 RepID=UPI00382BF4ED
MIDLLDPDATGVADGGGLASAAPRPVVGNEQIARYLVAVTATADDLTIVERTVNGQPGLVVERDGVTAVVIAFEVAGDRIRNFWAVANPEQLRLWTTG